MKVLNFLFVSLVTTSLTFAGCKKVEAKPIETPIATTTVVENTKIQVALLLDTSNSMDGLIEQAKSRLWNIVNTLTTLKYNGQTPTIEISLYEYGNSGLSQRDNYIKQITPLSTDLDLISEKLFALRTNGGEEYCGAVIQDASKKLSWGKDNNNMKLIYVCGNEAFDQGSISYKESIADALKNNIYVNTIFCGNQEEGINSFWKNGADVGKGKYFNIDSNQLVQYVVTPYDDKITKCINTTYINYGSEGDAKKANQARQDVNAESVSKANYADRVVSKSKAVYKNDSWDLVDKMKDDKEAVKKMKKEELPKELQNKSTAEITKLVEEKTIEREAIQKEIGELAKKRQEYIDAEAKKANVADDLGGAINASILTLAKAKGYTVVK
jgi:von Willebrand factor type A domain